nr:uncharacterized protein LOC105711646 [Aotus nancymaae]XP_012299872.1 uncharacterized protein LOC105711646 [Aotus nancymaae]XP_012299873.1 uncharacterized protein LOC105711646 [Aotus nancymaae]
MPGSVSCRCGKDIRGPCLYKKIMWLPPCEGARSGGDTSRVEGAEAGEAGMATGPRLCMCTKTFLPASELTVTRGLLLHVSGLILDSILQLHSQELGCALKPVLAAGELHKVEKAASHPENAMSKGRNEHRNKASKQARRKESKKKRLLPEESQQDSPSPLDPLTVVSCLQPTSHPPLIGLSLVPGTSVSPRLQWSLSWVRLCLAHCFSSCPKHNASAYKFNKEGTHACKTETHSLRLEQPPIKAVASIVNESLLSKQICQPL